MDAPNQEHGIAFLLGLIVQPLMKIIGGSMRRNDKHMETFERLHMRLTEQMNAGFSEMRGMFQAQNADIRELKVRQEDLRDRVTKIETSLRRD